jgi:hypothetical protein
MAENFPADDYLGDLERLLEEGFAARGQNFREKLDSVQEQIPEDLLKELHAIIRRRSEWGQTEDSPALAAFVFDCGKLVSRLDALIKERAETTLFAAQIAELPAALPESGELDAIGRFMAVRDRLMRKIADFTLKALLILTGLLIIGLVLGIV